MIIMFNVYYYVRDPLPAAALQAAAENGCAAASGNQVEPGFPKSR